MIAAVNGLCLGGGLEIMLSTDLRVCGEQARFALPEAGVGVVPAGGTLTRLVRQVPYALAMELMLLGDQVEADGIADRAGELRRAPRRGGDAASDIADSCSPAAGRPSS